MRILLDECLPRRLKQVLLGHEVRTVPEMGWASKMNGDLLAVVEADPPPLGNGTDHPQFPPPPPFLHELGRFQQILEDWWGLDDRR